ncbi:uncharacterized protein LOC135490624 [Lineus longissimus]|uniref:uncharacterized protein LOC135490624 n=1 Tax=Lineus longissimus TaxID=88925 RepID=UPI002B4D95A3
MVATSEDRSEVTPLDPKDELKKPTDEIEPLSKTGVFVLNLSWYGLNLVFLIMSVEVVPAQVQSMVGASSKGRWLGGMVAGGAVLTFLAGPLVGMKSDRLTCKYGKRRPIMVVAMLFLCCGMAGMALSAPNVFFTHLDSDKSACTMNTSLVEQRCRPYNTPALVLNHSSPKQQAMPILTKQDTSHIPDNSTSMIDDNRNILGLYIFFYLIVMASFVSLTVPYCALIADKSHPAQRGLNSGVMGAMILFGNISGAALGLFFMDLGVPTLYAVIVTIGVICVLITVFFTHEEPAKDTHDPCSAKELFFGFWEPLKEHDFRWVFLTRFLMQQGLSTTIGFMEFWLSDMVPLPNCWTPARGVAMLLLPLLLMAALSSIICGLLSDRIGRRKPLVLVSALVMCAASAVLAFLRGGSAFYIALAMTFFFGAGFGSYQAVDFALVMDVLPEEKEKGKDIAVWHQALVLPQALATPIGGILLDLFERVNCEIGLGYIMVFLVTSVYFLLSGLFVLKIRGVR